jgi:hypothetical protein
MAERGEPGCTGGVERLAVRGEVIKGGLPIAGLPQHDDVDYDAETVELILLPNLVLAPELASVAMEDVEPGFLQAR